MVFNLPEAAAGHRQPSVHHVTLPNGQNVCAPYHIGAILSNNMNQN